MSSTFAPAWKYYCESLPNVENAWDEQGIPYANQTDGPAIQVDSHMTKIIKDINVLMEVGPIRHS